MSLEQSAIREVSSLFGDDGALKRIISFTKSLKRESRKADANCDNVMTPEDKREILYSIKEGLEEVKMAREGEVKLDSWEDFKHELHR